MLQIPTIVNTRETGKEERILLYLQCLFIPLAQKVPLVMTLHIRMTKMNIKWLILNYFKMDLSMVSMKIGRIDFAVVFYLVFHYFLMNFMQWHVFVSCFKCSNYWKELFIEDGHLIKDLFNSIDESCMLTSACTSTRQGVCFIACLIFENCAL